MDNQKKTPYLHVPDTDQGLVPVRGVVTGRFSSKMPTFEEVPKHDMLDIAEPLPDTEEYSGVGSDWDDGMSAAGVDPLTPVDNFLAMQGRTSFLTEA